MIPAGLSLPAIAGIGVVGYLVVAALLWAGFRHCMSRRGGGR